MNRAERGSIDHATTKGKNIPAAESTGTIKKHFGIKLGSTLAGVTRS